MNTFHSFSKRKNLPGYACTIALFLLLFLVIQQPVTAQIRGFKTGMTLSTFSKTGNLYDNDHGTVAFTAGAFRAIPLQGGFSLMPELNYVRKGRSAHMVLPGFTAEADYCIHYLQLPLQLQYVNQQIVKVSGAQIHFLAGPYLAYAFKDKISGNLPGQPTSVPEDPKHDLGFSMGMGYQFPLASNFMRLDLKYDMGMTKMANQPDNFRTKALSLTLGYAF